MTVKYKVSDFEKDLSISAKKVLDELNAMGSTGKKNSSTLEENELNYLLEKFSKDNSVKNLDEFLNSAKAPRPRRSLPRRSLPRRRQSRRRRRSRRPRARKSPSLQRRRQSPTPSTTTARSLSSTRSGRRRPSPCGIWPVRPAQRPQLPPHSPSPSAARTIR